MARPKGSKNKQPQGLSLRKRLRLLQEISLDLNQKSVDRLAAIKLMSELLGDKIKDNNSVNPITTLKFTASELVNTQAEHINIPVELSVNTMANTVSEVLKPSEVVEDKEDNTFSMQYKIQPKNTGEVVGQNGTMRQNGTVRQNVTPNNTQKPEQFNEFDEQEGSDDALADI